MPERTAIADALAGRHIQRQPAQHIDCGIAAAEPQGDIAGFNHHMAVHPRPVWLKGFESCPN
jgi:hypothetical protein